MSKELPNPTGEPPTLLTRVRTTVTIAIVVMILFSTFVVYRYVVHAERQRAQAIFRGQTSNIQNLLREKFSVYLDTVQSIASLHDATGGMDRKHFKAFTARSLRENAGIQALEWAPLVKRDQRGRYEKEMRATGIEGFQFKKWVPEKPNPWQASSESWSSQYVPVYFVEPLEGNQKAHGIDLASHPVRRAALNQARDSGRPIATAPIKLAQETEDQAGFLIFVPIFSSGDSAVDSVDARRKRLAGYAAGVFRVGDIVSSVLPRDEPSDFDLRIRDLSSEKDPVIFYGDEAIDSGEAAVLRETYVFTLASRQWVFDFRSKPGYAAYGRDYAWLIIAGGIVLAFLVGTILMMLSGRATQIQRLAQQRTQELRETLEVQQRVFEATPIGMLIVNVDGKIQYVNSAACGIFGYDRDELIDRSAEIILPSQRRQYDLALRNVSFDPMQSCLLSTESRLVGIHRDGTRIELEIARSPIPMPEGPCVLASLTDITQKRRNEDELKRINSNLARFNKAAIGREMRMIELKKEINDLLEATGQPTKYDLRKRPEDMADRLAENH